MLLFIIILCFEQSKILFMTTKRPAEKLFPSSPHLQHHSTIQMSTFKIIYKTIYIINILLLCCRISSKYHLCVVQNTRRANN